MITRKLLLEHYKNILNLNNKGELKVAVITNDKCKEGGILMTGINPSGSDVQELYDYLDCWDIDQKNNFWDPKHEMMGRYKGQEVGGYDNKCAFIDLFPVRDGKQIRFEQNNNTNNQLMGQLLSETQDYIEALHPRLVINTNKQSKYYWGFNKVKKVGIANTFQDEYDKVWMGYEFEPINPSPLTGRQDKGYWDFYKIKGIVPSGVNKWRNKTSLVEGQDSYYLQYRQHKAYGNVVKPERQLTLEDIKCLVEWIDPKWANELLKVE